MVDKGWVSGPDSCQKDLVASVHKEEHAQIIKIIQSPGPQHIQAGHTQYFLHTGRCSLLNGIREVIVATLTKKINEYLLLLL